MLFDSMQNLLSDLSYSSFDLSQMPRSHIDDYLSDLEKDPPTQDQDSSSDWDPDDPDPPKKKRKKRKKKKKKNVMPPSTAARLRLWHSYVEEQRGLLPEDYALRPYQTEMISQVLKIWHGEDPHGFIIGWDMGTGKSLMTAAVVLADQLIPKPGQSQAKGGRTLIIAPRCLHSQWKKEFARAAILLDSTAPFKGLGVMNILFTSIYESNNPVGTAGSYEWMNNNMHIVGITTAQSASKSWALDSPEKVAKEQELRVGRAVRVGQQGGGRGRSVLQYRGVLSLKRAPPSMLVFDEVHAILAVGGRVSELTMVEKEKGFAGTVTRTSTFNYQVFSEIIQSIKTKRVLFLTATPLNNTVGDVENLIRFLDPERIAGCTRASFHKKLTEIIEGAIVQVVSGEGSADAAVSSGAQSASVVKKLLGGLYHSMPNPLADRVDRYEVKWDLASCGGPPEEGGKKRLEDAAEAWPGLLEETPSLESDNIRAVSAAHDLVCRNCCQACAHNYLTEHKHKALELRQGVNRFKRKFKMVEEDKSKRAVKRHAGSMRSITVKAFHDLSTVANGNHVVMNGNGLDNGKLTVLKRLIIEESKQEGQIVLFFEHTNTTLFRSVQHFCASVPLEVSQLTGMMCSADWDRSIARINAKGSRVKVIMSTQAAGGVGLDLDNATCVIIVERSWNPMKDAQAVARMIRTSNRFMAAGRRVKAITLTCSDDYSLDAIKGKVAMVKNAAASAVLGNPMRSDTPPGPGLNRFFRRIITEDQGAETEERVEEMRSSPEAAAAAAAEEEEEEAEAEEEEEFQ